MRLMGIEAAVPRRGTTRPAPGHTSYPYLLRNVEICRSNQVWSSDQGDHQSLLAHKIALIGEKISEDAACRPMR